MKNFNLPANLYHITTTERLAKIKEDKLLKAMPDTLTYGRVKGVFTFELENFATQWAKDKHMNFARLILDYISRGKEMTALRIPLKNIPKKELMMIKTREVKKVIDWKFGYYKPKNRFETDILGQHPSILDENTASERAVELILPNDIDINNIDTLGRSYYSSRLKLADIVMGFFKGEPEENIIKNNIDILG